MEWDSGEEATKKKMKMSSKILLAIITCIILIIILISVLILIMQQKTYSIVVDNATVNVDRNTLLTQVDNTTYVNIEEFAKLVQYEYHKGEYKTFTIQEDKCYVQGKNETATFYLNDNNVCKLPVNQLTEDYQEYSIDGTIKKINNTLYAPVDAIKLAFNVVVSETNNSFSIYTLDYLVSLYDEKVKTWGYTGISDENFENKKSLLYGYFIVKKENGLYKIIDDKNEKEIVSDKYTSIQFTENTKEFFVTNSLGQVGIINLDGTTKIEPVYNSISALDKKSDLYLVQKDKKYGVVKSGNITVIYPEYDSIGIDTKKITTNIDNQYLILDTLIPVCKENKWGAFDKEGKIVLNVEYDGFGCNLETVEINGIRKGVKPVFTIERCNGIVVQKNDKYGLVNTKGEELVPIAVDNIYEVENPENENSKYFMFYNGKELNIIERLIAANLIEDNSIPETQQENNEINNNLIDANSVNNSQNTVATSTNQNDVNTSL